MPPPSIARRPGAAGAGMKLGLVVGLIVLLLGGIGGATWWARTNRVAIDPDTLCPEQGPSAIHAILIDRSDPLTPMQQARVLQRIDEIVESAPVGGRVAIYLAESDGVEALPPALALCNPGRDANPLYQNPRRLRERYEQTFRDRIDALLARLMLPNPRQTSPIMESLKALCIDAMKPVPRGIPLQLSIVSDMIQHSPIASHYRNRDYRALLRSPRLQTLAVDCKGADVDILYLLRPTPQGRPGVQNRAHQEFWDQYLQHLNLRPVRMEPV